MIKQRALRELTDAEIDHVAGGDIDGNWCGTPVPHKPLPGLKGNLVQELVVPALAKPALTV